MLLCVVILVYLMILQLINTSKLFAASLIKTEIFGISTNSISQFKRAEAFWHWHRHRHRIDFNAVKLSFYS